ncbi:hypothetical protein WISP_88864 [Willisornis vidua]|uniref:Rna-directed dna polymerase from mobile element jockey-like n=1 Tax=Willisornis vidua TaxID=1566151 RepID=A0ABQ9D291_9PASS|nr:hypothetical protein WISP_88864 [Willisornis vidua]
MLCLSLLQLNREILELHCHHVLVYWVNILEERDVIQRNLDSLGSWAHASLIRFNKVKCKVLHLGQGKSKHKYRLGGEWLESSFESKDLEVVVDEKLQVTQQSALPAQKANYILNCFK